MVITNAMNEMTRVRNEAKFQYWLCVGIKDKINKTKHFSCLPKLPLVKRTTYLTHLIVKKKVMVHREDISLVM